MGCQRHTIVRREIVAEICFDLVAHPFGGRFTALIIFAGVKEAAVFTAMLVGPAMRAFVCAHDFCEKFDFPSAVMTDHSLPFAP